ncbi:MAG: efflux RND transporter periplasmic adaptor subunit [Fimbriimonadaceae bacterium]|nr:efflux RND transporter periplasmic adaptor subunit [Fimbriimonadaceae bacterium]
MRFFLRGFSVALAFCLAAMLAAMSVQAGPYRLDVVTEPALVPVGRAQLVVAVFDASGKPVEGAKVRAIAKMPGMNMGEKEQDGHPGDKAGVYRVPVVFAMGGRYEATITVDGPAGKGAGTLELTTGQSTGAGGGPDIVRFVVIGLGVALAILILVRMRRTGQSVNLKGIFSFSVLGSLLLLAGAIALSLWLIENKRRPGAMTPIEAQAMEMNTPAPEGVMPVLLAKAVLKPFAPTVRYSGQAMGFTEQAIVPRTTGVIVEMPVYVGDRVKKGQVLARLDTTQLDPEQDMQAAALSRSRQGVEVAALEYEAALSEVATARAEIRVAQGEVEEAQSMLDAAREGKESAEADVAIAQAEIANMEAMLTSAQASQTFAGAEVERQRGLAEKGFVSQKEAQRARTEADRADAEVRQAEQQLRKANSGLRAAQSAVRRVAAEIEAARVKVENAKRNANAKEAVLRRAEQMAGAAKARVGQEKSSVSESSANLRRASAQKGYATLRAETDGVIVERTIAPGQLVSPGQTILRLARTSPIRLQANVPEADLAQIEPGASVEVALRDSDQKPLRLRVTSVAPSVDTGARMGVVEALYDNKDQRFLPGQFISMTVSAGEPRDALVIPSSAVVRRGKQMVAWVASDSILQRRDVIVGRESGEEIQIVEGLKAGELVVVDPGPDLRSGIRVAPVEDEAEDNGMTIIVTESGYDPPSLDIPANKPVTLTFIRKTEATCGNEVIFPDLKIEKKLPMNEPIKIEIPPRQAGTLRFTCGMDMLEGKLVIR